jgi:hypothetical protein
VTSVSETSPDRVHASPVVQPVATWVSYSPGVDTTLAVDLLERPAASGIAAGMHERITPRAIQYVAAESVDAVVRRADAELTALESGLLTAMDAAERCEAQARAEGADLEASAWVMVRFRQFLSEMRDEVESDVAELFEVAHRQASRIRRETSGRTPAAIKVPQAPPVPAMAPEAEAAWDLLAAPIDPAVGSEDEFWADAADEPTRRRRAFPVAAGLRVAAVTCLAGAVLLHFA